MLATADLESRLVAVDLASGAIVGHIPTVAYPRSIETVGNTAVVAHSEVGRVSLIDGRERGGSRMSLMALASLATRPGIRMAVMPL